MLSVQENSLKLLSNLRRHNFANHDHDGDYCHPRWIKVLLDTAGSFSVQLRQHISQIILIIIPHGGSKLGML